MTEPKRLEAEALETVISDREDFVWPPVSSADIVWLEPNPTVRLDDEVGSAPSILQIQDLPASPVTQPLIQDQSAPTVTLPPVYEQSALPLSRLLSPQVVCEWHDAVAVVQQVAEQIMHGLRDEPRGSIPDVHRIGIEPSGQLRVRLDTRGIEPLARGLGRLLYRLLANRDSPAAVRLIVSQTMSDLPTIRSVADFVRELARWERPYRAQKLAELYERALNAPDISPSPPAMTEFDPLDEPAAVFPLTGVEGSPPRRLAWSQGVIESLLALKASRPLVAISAAAVVCLALAMVAAMVALRSRPSVAATPFSAANAEKPSGSNLSPSASIELPPADVESPSVGGPSAPPPVQQTNPVAQQATVRDVTPRSSAGTSVRSTAPVIAPSAAKSVNTRPAQAAPKVAAAAPAAAPTITVAAPTVTIAAPTVTAPPTVTAAAPTTSATPGAPEPVAPDRLYTSIDPGVVAPVLVRPYLPELSDPNAQNLRLGVLEVVVGTTGLVESVRLRSPENRYRERWWLFVAKNWQFRPAYKDGQPVRYLKVIPLTDVRLSDPQ